MRVFVTGASGFVGSGVTRELIKGGHQVVGLARSDKAAATVAGNGATVLRGELGDLAVLRDAAREADAVIHCGFIHDFSNYAASVGTDKTAIETLGDALAGTGKALIVTAGMGVKRTGPLATEDDDADISNMPRLSEPTGLAQVAKGVRAMVMRLPPSVHGPHDHGFVAALVAIARQTGTAAYVGEGKNVWSSVHRDDAARAYVLALENGVAGGRYHAVADEGVPFRQIAEAIGRKLGVPVQSVTPEQAAEVLSWQARFAQFDAPASSALTRQRLGWTPAGSSLLEDIETGTYFDAVLAAAE